MTVTQDEIQEETFEVKFKYISGCKYKLIFKMLLWNTAYITFALIAFVL